MKKTREKRKDWSILVFIVIISISISLMYPILKFVDYLSTTPKSLIVNGKIITPSETMRITNIYTRNAPFSITDMFATEEPYEIKYPAHEGSISVTFANKKKDRAWIVFGEFNSCRKKGEETFQDTKTIMNGRCQVSVAGDSVVVYHYKYHQRYVVGADNNDKMIESVIEQLCAD